MKDSEKDRLAGAVVECWCTFEEALCGGKRKYPLQEFLSFADTARHYIEATRHDRLIRRDVAKTINGLTEQLGSSASVCQDECSMRPTGWSACFSKVSIPTSRETHHPACSKGDCSASFRTGAM